MLFKHSNRQLLPGDVILRQLPSLLPERLVTVKMASLVDLLPNHHQVGRRA